MLPVNGLNLLRNSPLSAVLPPCLHPTDALCTPRFSLHSSLLYPHSTLCTKTLCSGICTLVLDTFRRLFNYFSLLNTLQSLIQIPWVVSLLTYVHDLYRLRLPLFRFSSNHIASLVFSLSLLSFPRRILFFCTWAQIQYDIYIPTSYVINYSCRSFE